MTIVQLIFYAFSILAVFSSLLVVSSSNPVRGVLFLVLTFFAMAGIWLLMQAEFLALILVLVYVGAVMTLFLFVVMMLSVDRINRREGFVKYLPLCLLLIAAMVGLTIMVINPQHFGLNQFAMPEPAPANYSNMASLGLVLYTDYALPFEIAAVLLLTGIVAAISLTHRKRKKVKSQIISQQIEVKAADRMKLVNLPSSPLPKSSNSGGV